MNEAQIINVSQRLKLLGAMLPKVAKAADIGTDHAQLLVYLIQNEKIQQGIGVEVVEGPYRNAIHSVSNFGLSQAIEIRKGDGLAPIQPGETEAVIIAGMGGGTIVGILERSPEVLKSLQYLILQPMSQPSRLRQYLQQVGWGIREEILVEDRDIIYPLIKASPGAMESLDWVQAEYGPLLILEKPALLYKLILRDIESMKHVLRQLAQSTQEESRQREQEIRSRCKQLEELLS